MKVTFIGAGAFGTAIAKIAEHNQHSVKFYDPFKFKDVTLETAIKDADVVVYVAPSDQLDSILPHLDSETPLICASKGLLSLEPFKNFKKFSILSGAAFPEDIYAALGEAKPRYNTLGCTAFTATSKLSKKLFQTKKIRVSVTPVKNSLGIIYCGALKNIYAIGAGLYYGNSPADDNIFELQDYLNQVISEFQYILDRNGISPIILTLPCGITDLIITCSSMSRNYRFGRALKIDKPIPENTTLEGLSAIQAILDKSTDFILPDDAAVIRDIIRTVRRKFLRKQNPKKRNYATK